ncbi:MAG: hypothetical protein ACFE9L_14120 [Candidatus Hodarchaeota archaeon]
MKQFVIHLGTEQNEILVKIGKELGKHHVDIVSMAGTTAFGICTAVLLTNNEKLTIKALRDINIPFSTQDVLIASLPDEPGAFGHFTQLLLDQGIHLLSFYAVRFTESQAEYAFSVSETDFEKAQSFLDASGYLKSSDDRRPRK